MLVFDVLSIYIAGEGGDTDCFRQGSKAVLGGSNPLSTEIKQSSVAGRLCISTSTDAVTRLQDDHIDSCRCECSGSSKTRETCTNYYDIGVPFAQSGWMD